MAVRPGPARRRARGSARRMALAAGITMAAAAACTPGDAATAPESTTTVAPATTTAAPTTTAPPPPPRWDPAVGLVDDGCVWSVEDGEAAVVSIASDGQNVEGAAIRLVTLGREGTVTGPLLDGTWYDLYLQPQRLLTTPIATLPRGGAFVLIHRQGVSPAAVGPHEVRLSAASLADPTRALDVSCTPAEPRSLGAPQPLGPRILLVGDSIVHGAVTAFGIAPFLEEEFPGAEVVVLGGAASGPDDGRWISQMEAWLGGGFDADIVVIQACCKGYVSDGGWQATLDAVIEVARANDPGGDRQVVLATSPGIAAGTSPWFEAAGVPEIIESTNRVARSLPGVLIADIDAAWAVDGAPSPEPPGIGPVRSPDGLHLSEAGGRSAAAVIGDAVRRGGDA